MKNIIYIGIVFLGFLTLLISLIVINKKIKVFSLEKLIYSYIFSMLFFLIFAKFIHLLIEFDFTSLKNFIIVKDIESVLSFILSGYSFLGGYIGIVVSIYFFSRITKSDFNEILVLYTTSMIIMYSILKIGCFIKDCCIGKSIMGIQIIESLINLGLYIFLVLKINNNLNKLIGKSIVLFFLIRFIISLFRVYSSIYSFIIVEIICLVLLLYGIKIYRKKEYIYEK